MAQGITASLSGVSGEQKKTGSLAVYRSVQLKDFQRLYTPLYCDGLCLPALGRGALKHYEKIM